MSRVTNLILCHSISEPHTEVMDGADLYPIHNRLNAFFSPERGLVDVEAAGEWGWYGGSKMLEMEVLIGAFNFLDLDAFMAHLARLPWENPAAVAVLVQEQEEDRPRLLCLPETPIEAAGTYGAAGETGVNASGWTCLRVVATEGALHVLPAELPAEPGA